MEDMQKSNMSDISEIKKTLTSWLKSAVMSGPEKMNVVDLKETADAIKDLAEAEKECHEAEYYKSVVKAMESGDDEPAYLESMRSGRMGYRPVYGMGYPQPSMQGDRGYYTASSYIPANDFSTSMKMEEPRNYEQDPDRERYGRAFSEYRRARRNYTETHSQSDKREMEAMAQNHLANAISTMKEMWSSAEPEMRAKMKNDLTKLINEMNV